MHICPNGKKYVGITGQKPERRWQNGAGYFYESNSHFENAIKKYGWDSIKHEILLKNLTKEDAEKAEIYFIKKYKTTDRKFGYNIDSGGTGCGKHTEEYKKRMSEMQKNIWKNSPERKEKMSKFMSGKKLSEETKEKIRKSNTGKKQSFETIKKRVEKTKGVKKPKTSYALKKAWEEGRMRGLTGRKRTERQREAAKKQAATLIEMCKKPVLAYDKKGNFIGEFESGAFAGRALNISNSKISEVCKGKRKSCYGYIFKYKKEE